MNYEPVLYCFECGRVRPREEMEFVSPGKKRKACTQCRERIDRFRRAAKRRQGALRSK